MAEFPALPLFTDAYLGDTTHLTTIEHGAYLLLLIVAWRSPSACLPDDDEKLARYARMTRGQWARIAPTIREFFTAEHGSLFQSRLTDEAARVRQVRDAQAAAGRASALKRNGRHSTKRDGERKVSEADSANQSSTPSPSPSPTLVSPAGDTKTRKRAIEKPDDVTETVWSDWCAHRKQKRAPITQTALDGIRREAGKAGWTMDAALAECCNRGWQGFNADWVKGNGNGGYRNGGNGADKIDGFASALRRAEQATRSPDQWRADDDG